ncbi:MAG: flavodoxin family protein [Clostridiales bacterium]|jgi:multimeric flavodoxin WrbA|nr:flavodoxin family protein [Clostridiales bacterium]
MKIMIISSSPNTDGLTAACVHAAQLGVEKEGFETIQIRLNDLNIGRCHACGNGWGTCLDRHECQVLDDFQKLHQSMADIDGYIIITPVYWGEMSESAKAFFDRLRRCEATKRDKNYIEGKPIIAVAAAGGSGNGIVSCLASMERLITHIRGKKFDLMGITRYSREYMLHSIQNAAGEMAASIKRAVSQ